MDCHLLCLGLDSICLFSAALSLFSVPGDKHVVVVRVSGRVRIALEAMIAVAGVVAALQAWFLAAAVLLLLGNLILFGLSRQRLSWLWQH